MTPREKAAYELVLRLKQPRLSPDTQTRLFSLFVNGIDCVKIAAMNRGISLGQICIARVEGRWDEKRNEHTESLLRETRRRLEQISLESIDFLSTQLAVAHKLHGDNLKKFLQTGDPNDLGGFAIHGFKAYREAIELLRQVTGADKKGAETQRLPTTPETAQSIPSVNRVMTVEEARDVRRRALESKNGK